MFEKIKPYLWRGWKTQASEHFDCSINTINAMSDRNEAKLISWLIDEIEKQNRKRKQEAEKIESRLNKILEDISNESNS